LLYRELPYSLLNVRYGHTMNHLLRTSILIVTAMAGCALIIAALFGVIRSVGVFGRDPADFVPVSEVQAILFHPSERSLKEFSDIKSNEAEAIVILTTPDGAAAVQFIRDAKQSDGSIGPYILEVDNVEARDLIGIHEQPLSSDVTFSTLKTHASTETEWAFLSASLFPQGASLFADVLKALLVAKSSGVALWYIDNDISVRHISDALIAKKAPTTIPEMPDSFAVFAFGNGQASFRSLQQSLQKDDAIVLEGLLQEAVHTYGKNISLQYDILPLLKEPSSVQLSASGGVLNILLSGSMQETKSLHSILDRLHAEYERTLPSSKITKRVLDKRFSSIDIRHDPTMIERNQRAEEGWLVRSTSLAGSHKEMVTATQSNAFIIGTTRADVAHAIQHQRNVHQERVTTRTLLDLSQLEPFYPSLGLQQKEVSSKFGTGSVYFVSNLDGKIRSTTIGSSRIPLQLLDLLR
jgi:hypothetical protein